MKIVNSIQEMFEYIWGGVKRIFGASDDHYPETGVQPYEGDPAKDRDNEEF
ncbi:MAG: hypothetical protein ACP5D7_14065 [Limnospira sp.]